VQLGLRSTFAVLKSQLMEIRDNIYETVYNNLQHKFAVSDYSGPQHKFHFVVNRVDFAAVDIKGLDVGVDMPFVYLLQLTPAVEWVGPTL
jgi:hypothetical protein